MKIRLFYAIFCLLLISLIPQTIHSCTTFCLDKGNQLVVGSNLDWYAGEGLVFVNKRNTSKTAMLHPVWGEGNPVSWTSKYGSVTFNGAGREIVFSGMNEAGLVVSIMLLEETEYPKADSRPAIFAGQWNQYQLDNFSTVQEVIASLSKISIICETPMNIHFFVSDRMGNSAITEFINGNTIYYTKDTLPVKTLANSTYEESINYWKKKKVPPNEPYLSLWRFIKSADMVKAYDLKTSAVDYAFDILKNVSMGTVEEVDGMQIKSMITTEWSIVHDIKNLRVYFRTFDNKKIRYIDLGLLDFSCNTPVMILDIQADLNGDVSKKFINYNYEMNRDLILKTVREPDEVKDYIAKYPETTICTE